MFFRYAFVFLALVVFICVLVQIFLAGLAIFESPALWRWHTTFVHIFELAPLLMLPAAWLGKAPRRLLWYSAGLLGMIYVQDFTANFRAISGAVAALHPLTGMVIAWMAYRVLLESRALLKSRAPQAEPQPGGNRVTTETKEA